jgi:hypothetical protein
MNKNKKQNVNQMCEKLGLVELTIPTLDGEEWKKLETPLYPYIQDYYYISNRNGNCVYSWEVAVEELLGVEKDEKTNG